MPLQGISTYDYIIAMRERDQHINVESFPSPYASPSSSVATAVSGASSTGALHHAAWCTPPRLFVDHEVFSFVCPPFTFYNPLVIKLTF